MGIKKKTTAISAIVLIIITSAGIFFWQHHFTSKKIEKISSFLSSELDTYSNFFGSVKNEQDFNNFKCYLKIKFKDYVDNVFKDLNIKIEFKSGKLNIFHTSKFIGLKYDILSMRIELEPNCPEANKFDYFFIYSDGKPSLDTLLANKLLNSIYKEFELMNKMGVRWHKMNDDKKNIKIVFTIIEGDLKFQCTDLITNKEFLNILSNNLKALLSRKEYQNINFARYEVFYPATPDSSGKSSQR